jgi:hypothetical protein
MLYPSVTGEIRQDTLEGSSGGHLLLGPDGSLQYASDTMQIYVQIALKRDIVASVMAWEIEGRESIKTVYN